MSRQPGSIDFSHPSYKYKYACFTCRKMFKKGREEKDDSNHLACIRCLSCGKHMTFNAYAMSLPYWCTHCRSRIDNRPLPNFPIKSFQGDSEKCPECSEKLYFVGLFFKPPKRSDKEAWAVVERLIKSGILYSEGTHNSLPGPRPTRLRDVDQFIANYRADKKASFTQAVETAIHSLVEYSSEDKLETDAQQRLEYLLRDYAKYVEIDPVSTLNTMIEGARRMMQASATQATDM